MNVLYGSYALGKYGAALDERTKKGLKKKRTRRVVSMGLYYPFGRSPSGETEKRRSHNMCYARGRPARRTYIITFFMLPHVHTCAVFMHALFVGHQFLYFPARVTFKFSFARRRVFFLPPVCFPFFGATVAAS